MAWRRSKAGAGAVWPWRATAGLLPSIATPKPNAHANRTGMTVSALRPRRSYDGWLGAAILLVGMIVLADALIGEQSLTTGIRARGQYQAADAALLSLHEENARLREEVRRLRDDPQAIEYLARKDLGLARRGEILVVLK
jgi:cell division protein FtsB